MSVQHTIYLLKVLSGANTGAIVRLKTGDIIIGRSMESDIILHDNNIADKHIKLNINNDVITLRPLVMPVYIDGEEVGMGEVEITPYQVVQLGDVEFFIADPRQNEKDIQPLGGAHIKHKIKKRNAVDAAALEKNEKKGFLSEKMILGLGLLLLLIANFIYFAPSILKFAEEIGLKPSPTERAEEVLSELDPKQFDIKTASSGKVTIIGYVKNQAERSQIIRKIRRSGQDVSYRIWVESELAESAEMVSHTLGERSIRFKPISKGDVSATGYVSNSQDWDRIKSNILEDVAGITSINEDNLQTLVKRMEALQQFIEKNDLSSRIRVSIDKGKIKVSGELTKSEIARWNDLYSEFLAVYGEGPSIIENLYDARDRIKLSIRSVSVGETPFLVSKDGKKYMEGSSLGNNYFIKKIKPDHIVLTNKGIEIPIYYGLEEK